MKNFGTILREARTQAGLTQKELANEVGLDHSYISKIERNTNDPPSREKVLAMLDVLNLKDNYQRVYFLLAAGCASLDDFIQVDKSSNGTISPAKELPFSDGSLFFPDSNKIEEEVLVEKIRRLLSNTDISPQDRKELIDTIRSFVDWLHYKFK